ncbi:5-formyltetrahydrofolate cyclo-ligase [Clostridium septicum]|uniref:5-formyltetrahydrofolate cyclo-ligase n=1 Tax=Clostridium septicum TaxID=1504 RepID=UPI003216A204
MKKKELRNRVLEFRNDLSKEEKCKKDNKILRALLDSELYKNSNNIFVYINYGSEINTKEFINIAIKDRKKIFVPKIIKELKEMKAVQITSLNNLMEDNYGILEPNSFEGSIEKDKLDLIIVPGVVFDLKGNRIGYGGGYYDRYLSEIKLNSNRVALAYELQIKNSIDVDEYDINVNYIITEDRIINM